MPEDSASWYPELLSIVIPCYNEEATLGQVLELVRTAPPIEMRRQMIVVDDGSTDTSVAIVEAARAKAPDKIEIVRQPQNQGKGAAVRTGLAHARGEIVLIQDADLEYEPKDYPELLAPFADPKVEVGLRLPNPRKP